jgi:hypothetical protein
MLALIARALFLNGRYILKIQNIINGATALGLGALTVSKGAHAAPAADRYEVSARSAAPAAEPATLDAPRARNVARAPTTKYEGSYSFDALYPPCSAQPELVHVDFAYQGHYKSDFDAASNTYTYKTQFQGKGAGVSESGVKYQLIQVDSGRFENTFDASGFAQEGHYVDHYKIVQQGTGTVYASDANVKYTYDSVNGYQVQVEKISFKCTDD